MGKRYKEKYLYDFYKKKKEGKGLYLFGLDFEYM